MNEKTAQKKKRTHTPTLYRPYDFPTIFPVLSFFGQNWLVSMHTPQFLHFHNCFEIGHCITGSGEICFRDYSLPFGPGQFSVINPLEPHMSVCDREPSQWEYIFFDPTLLFLAPSDSALCQSFYLSDRHSCLIDEKQSPFLFETLTAIFREFQEKRSFYPAALHSLLFVLLAELNQSESAASLSETSLAPDSRIAPVRLALLYLYSHYMDPLTVSRLADLCCLSESHFRRIFKEIIGISPLEYLEHYRIQRACHMILQKQQTINEIAKAVGYQTLSSFNRQFLQYTGVSPSAWKKLH